MKSLPPSLRENRRYLKFRVHSDEKKELGEVVDAVWNSCLSYIGTAGCSEANFWVIGNRFDEDTQEGIIKVRRQKEDEVRAALTMINQIGGSSGFIEVKRVSGTLEALDS